jgi:hypothetical protein
MSYRNRGYAGGRRGTTKRAPITTYQLIDVLRCSLDIIERFGFVSRADAAALGGQAATSTLVADALTNNPAQIFPVKHDAEIQNILAWFTSANATTDFMASAKAFVASGLVTSNLIGTAAAMPNTYRNAMKREEEQRAANDKFANSEWIGTEGQKGEFFLALLESRFLNGVGCHMHKLCDADHNLVLIFGKPLTDVEPGDCIEVSARVKRHSISKYSKLKETVLNYVKIKTNHGSPSNPKNQAIDSEINEGAEE